MPEHSPHAPLLCLASGSPRRRALLEQLGLPHVLALPDVDEAVLPGESAADYVVRMARTKARVVHPHGAALPVLAADTIVLIDGRICGKPADAEDGIAMLLQLSGRGSHREKSVNHRTQSDCFRNRKGTVACPPKGRHTGRRREDGS